MRRSMTQINYKEDYKQTTCVHRTNMVGSFTSAIAGPAMAIAQSPIVISYLNISEDSQCYGGLTTAATTIPPIVTCLAGATDVNAYANQTNLLHASFHTAYEKMNAAIARMEETPASKALDALGKLAYDEVKQEMTSYETGCYQQKWVHISTAILAGGIIAFAVPPAATVLPCVSTSIAPTVQGGLVTVLGGASSLIQNRSVREYDKLSRYLHKNAQEMKIFAQLAEEVLLNEEHPEHTKLIEILNNAFLRMEEAQSNPDLSLTPQKIYEIVLESCAGILANQRLKVPTSRPMGGNTLPPARQQTNTPEQSPESARSTASPIISEPSLPGLADDQVVTEDDASLASENTPSTTRDLLSQLASRRCASMPSRNIARSQSSVPFHLNTDETPSSDRDETLSPCSDSDDSIPSVQSIVITSENTPTSKVTPFNSSEENMDWSKPSPLSMRR